MTNEIREEKEIEKKTQPVTTNEIKEEKKTKKKKKHNPTTQPNSTQRCLSSLISKFTLGCDFTNPIYMSWIQKIY